MMAYVPCIPRAPLEGGSTADTPCQRQLRRGWCRERDSPWQSIGQWDCPLVGRGERPPALSHVEGMSLLMLPMTRPRRPLRDARRFGAPLTRAAPIDRAPVPGVVRSCRWKAQVEVHLVRDDAAEVRAIPEEPIRLLPAPGIRCAPPVRGADARRERGRARSLVAAHDHRTDGPSKST